MFRGHPPALRALFFTEMWERFSYYGMRALLVLYMTQRLGWSMADAATVYGIYTGLVYFTPVVGGFVADRYLGLERSVLLGASTMALGHFALALPGLPAFYAGLSLLVLGCGLFKPCVSVLVGKLYAPDDARRDAGFSLFYMGINLGGFLSPLVCGTLGQAIGFHWGFGCAGLGMLLSFAIFLWGYMPVGGAPVAVAPTSQPSRQHSFSAARPTALPSASVSRRLLVLAMLACFGNIAFWAAFEQAGSSIEIFVDRYVDVRLAWLSSANLSSLVQSVNPLFIIVLAPLFASLWQSLHQRGREPSAPTKFVLGLLLCATSFAWLSYLGAQADHGQRVSLSALSFGLLLSSCAELCISPVGLSFVSRLAPARYVSAVMGLWMASIALANVGSGTFASRFDDMKHAVFFGLIGTFCLGSAALLMLMRPWMNRAIDARTSSTTLER